MDRTNAGLYGSGIFTTIAIRNGGPLFWDKHWRRLTHNAAQVGIDLSGHSEQSTCSTLEGSILEQGTVDGRLRITFTDDRPSEIWPESEPEQLTSLYVIVGENHLVQSPFRMTISPYPVNSRSPLAGVKSCNYLENILAINEAKERGFHEAVRINEWGHVTGGCMANVFWLKGDRLYTPALSTGCLAGTTREFVLENIECDQVEAGLDELTNAEAVFLTSAGLGVIRADILDGRAMPAGVHAIQQLL